MENKNIIESLLSVQQELKNIECNADNPYYNSRYADLTHIINVLRPLLIKNALLVMHDTTIENNIFYVKTTLFKTENEKLSVKFCVPLDKIKMGQKKENSVNGIINPQQIGSLETYGIRYNLRKLFNLTTETDDDGNSFVPQPTQPKKYKEINFIEIDKKLISLSVDESRQYFKELKKEGITKKQEEILVKKFQDHVKKIDS
jgi:hypothetical protein